MSRPTNAQSQRIEREETGALRMHAAMRALDVALKRLGQLRRRGYPELVDYTIGDVAEALSYLQQEWETATQEREQIVKEVMDA